MLTIQLGIVSDPELPTIETPSRTTTGHKWLDNQSQFGVIIVPQSQTDVTTTERQSKSIKMLMVR